MDPKGCYHTSETVAMELELYKRLSTRSRRAMKREKGKCGKIYRYQPRWNLLQRLSEETGLSTEQVYQQLQRERLYLLDNGQ